ncbi:ABC transporter permease subunit [Chenggangzhangella methanolivorans]|uniref:ABC transporter permease subunit n=1 Tax=Chenggangzhangella methanolivorans TaxID=1437009 RepID=A0A9E6UN66_9HYPH|nr:ABC transporter permease subunit [Chenggangzhangella methanolivorans]
MAALSFGPGGWGDELLAGVGVTVGLALTSLVIGLAIGLGVAALKNARGAAPRALGEAYTTVFRGLPELLTLFLVYYGAPRLAGAALGLAESLLGLEPSGQTPAVSAFWAGTTALALVFGAYASETFSGAIRGVPDGQREAAEALGFSRAQGFRLVILPQVWRLALPGLSANWLTLLKDTSLVSVIALPDLMRQSYLASLSTKQPFLFYLTACLIYLALAGLSALVVARIEARTSRGLATAGR